MEGIKFSVFDFFAYALPGSVFLLAGVIFFDANLIQLSDISSVVQSATIATGIVVLIASYIIGFLIDSPGSWIYYKIGCKIWGQPYNAKTKRLSHIIERVLIRQFSPESNSYVHNWKVLKTMSHNLSFSSLVLAISTFNKSLQVNSQHQMEWVVLTVVLLLSSVIFLHRATRFDKWHYRDLTETVMALHLEQRALKEAETKTNGKKDNDILEELLVNHK